MDVAADPRAGWQPLADARLHSPVDRLTAAGFDHATVAAIRGGNAARLLGPLASQGSSSGGSA